MEERRDVLIEAAPDAELCAVGTDGLLFVGSEDAAHNSAGLEAAGVGAILNVAFGHEGFVGRFRYKRAPLLDVPETRLDHHLEDALQEARASAQDVVRHHLDNGLGLGTTCVEVRNENGVTVASLTVAEVLAHPVHPHFKADCAELPKPGHA